MDANIKEVLNRFVSNNYTKQDEGIIVDCLTSDRELGYELLLMMRNKAMVELSIKTDSIIEDVINSKGTCFSHFAPCYSQETIMASQNRENKDFLEYLLSYFDDLYNK